MKNKLSVIALVIAVVALGFAYFGPAKQNVKEVTKLGAIPGTEISSNCFTVGGVTKCYVTGSCPNSTTAGATTTFLSVLNPLGATSTWKMAWVDITGSATTGPIGITVATSTNQFVEATSTASLSHRFPGWGLISGVAISQGAFGYIHSGNVIATSSGAGATAFPTSGGVSLSAGTTTQNVTIGPNEYVVGHASGTGYMPTACKWGLEFER